VGWGEGPETLLQVVAKQNLTSIWLAGYRTLKNCLNLDFWLQTSGSGSRLEILPECEVQVNPDIGLTNKYVSPCLNKKCILYISSGQNIQLLTRNPILRSKVRKSSAQGLKIRENYLRKCIVWVVLFMDFRFQTWESSSGADFLCRFQICGQHFRIQTSRGQNLRKHCFENIFLNSCFSIFYSMPKKNTNYRRADSGGWRREVGQSGGRGGSLRDRENLEKL
jgi:hypothetical protein